eukprot:28072-Rhodomonas_salina.2
MVRGVKISEITLQKGTAPSIVTAKFAKRSFDLPDKWAVLLTFCAVTMAGTKKGGKRVKLQYCKQ